MTPLDNRKIAPEKQKENFAKSADSRNSSKTIVEFVQENDTSTKQNEEHDRTTSKGSFKDLYIADGFDEHNAVPDAVEYQVPFGHLVPDKSTNTGVNISEKHGFVIQKQFYEISQELNELRNVMARELKEMRDEMARELKEIRDEMKHHRKWY